MSGIQTIKPIDFKFEVISSDDPKPHWRRLQKSLPEKVARKISLSDLPNFQLARNAGNEFLSVLRGVPAFPTLLIIIADALAPIPACPAYPTSETF